MSYISQLGKKLVIFKVRIVLIANFSPDILTFEF